MASAKPRVLEKPAGGLAITRDPTIQVYQEQVGTESVQPLVRLGQIASRSHLESRAKGVESLCREGEGRLVAVHHECAAPRLGTGQGVREPKFSDLTC